MKQHWHRGTPSSPTICRIDEGHFMNDVKKRRLDGASLASIATVGIGGELPAELWANVLGYLYFGEVLACTAVNKVFRNDVTRQLKYLLIGRGESMDIMPAAIERFVSVEMMLVYLIKTPSYTFDNAALQHMVPFMSKLPNLRTCYVCDDDDSVSLLSIKGCCRKIRHGRRYETGKLDVYEPNSEVKFAGLIHSVCRAFKRGMLCENVEFRGFNNDQYLEFDQLECAWKNIPKIDAYRNDVPCQTCEMICNSFPPLRVLEFDLEDIPCISYENRINIVKYRDEDKAQDLLTKALLSAIQISSLSPVKTSLPELATARYCAINCEDYEIRKMWSLVDKGASVSDPGIRQYLLMKRENCYNNFYGQKPIFSIKAFNHLKALGININEDDCIVVGKSDGWTFL